jgi:uncharacterized protein
MQLVTPFDCSRIAQDLQIRKVQVESVVHLLDEGNTVPFITRYRKERTGGLNEEVIRQVQARIGMVRQLAERKQTILKSLETHGKLTAELRTAILSADTSKRLEDLYLPYKPKKHTLATVARDRGLEPLALAVWGQDKAVANLDEVLPTLVNPEKALSTPADVLLGMQHILAERVAETADVRAVVRSVLWETGKLCSAKSEKLAEGQGLDYKDYFQFTESVRQIPPHRILALNRGEKEGSLKVKLEWNVEAVQRVAIRALAENLLRAAEAPVPAPVPVPAPPRAEPAAASEMPVPEMPPPEAAAAPAPSEVTPPAPAAADAPAPAAAETALAATPKADIGDAPPVPPAPPPAPIEMTGEPLCADSAYRSPHATFLKAVADDALTRLLLPSLEREIRRELTDEAEAHAVSVFARNLRSLLLAPPLRSRRVLAIDPGFRTGCKVAALDDVGSLLEEAVVFPHQPQNKKDEAKVKLAELILKHQLNVVAIGNGTACRETEELISDLIAFFEKRRHPEACPGPEGVLSTTSVAAAPAAPEPSVTAAAPPEPCLAAPITAPEPASPVAEPVPATDSPDFASFVVLPDTTPVLSFTIGAELAGSSVPTEPPVSLTAAAPPRPQPPAPVYPPGLAPPDLAYVIVNEAGASVYSASAIGREEFPNYDATLRGTISIGRRLQDPLSELVKIDPQNIGVGLYQHDVNPRHLKDSLEGIIESCVNQVGVDLNTASVPLLRHVSGLNQLAARELVDFRKRNGPFKCRADLLQVPNIGPARYVQAAGFLKIGGGANPLDYTWIHPESYPAAERLIGELGYGPDVLLDKNKHEELQSKLKSVSPEEVANRLSIGVPTLRDILDALARPGRDPREDLPPPIFKKGILKLEDLNPGMELKGTVLNVVDFGAFVDIGLKESGLVHISQMANRYIKSPYDVVAVSDVVTVWVLTVDKERHRVSLTMIKPGTERKPPERKPPPPRQAQGGGSRPPRGRRSGPRHGQPPRPGTTAPAQAAAPVGRGAQGAQGAQANQATPAQVAQADQAAPADAAPAPAASQTSPPAAAPRPPAGRPSGPPPRPAPPPRKPRRESPRPKLSQAALEGKTPLRTLGELAAYFAAKQTPAEAEKKTDEAVQAKGNGTTEEPRAQQ